MIRLFLAALLLVLPAAAQAQCAGQNLLPTLPADQAAEIAALTAAQPYPTGNFWTATRGTAELTILGTYHFDDPRHAPALALGTARIAQATTLLVEAGPEEEAALKAHVARNPEVMMITNGPTLIDQLPPDTWTRLSDALSLRGIPGFMAAKLQPWYATVLLAVPPCAMAQMADPKGLDGQLIDAALAAGVPIRALEPYDTLFAIFDSLTPQQMVGMIDSSLAMEPQAEDFAATLADTYFAGESRKMWEMMRVLSTGQNGATRAQVDAELAVMEEALMARRNRAWIPVIEGLAEQGPMVVAFGALHLAGQDGVLNLLAANGWTLTPLALP